MVTKIKELFDLMNCKAVAILQTPNSGNIVDNNHGVDFELSEYAVIHSGNATEFYDKYEIKMKFEDEHKTSIITFFEDGCKPDVNALINELIITDEYKLLWKENKND